MIVQRTSGYLSPEISENASALAIRKALKNSESLASSTPMEEILKKVRWFILNSSILTCEHTY